MTTAFRAFLGLQPVRCTACLFVAPHPAYPSYQRTRSTAPPLTSERDPEQILRNARAAERNSTLAVPPASATLFAPGRFHRIRTPIDTLRADIDSLDNDAPAVPSPTPPLTLGKLSSAPSSVPSLPVSRAPSPVKPLASPVVTPSMAAAPKGLGALPSRHSSGRPKFKSSHPDDVEDFLFEIDSLAVTYQLDPKEKVHAAVRYADSTARKYWKTFDGYDDDVAKCSWARFKTEILEHYNVDVEDNRKELEDVVTRAAKKTFKTRAQFTQYRLDFDLHANPLIKSSKLPASEADIFFWKGFRAGSFKESVKNNLKHYDHTFSMLSIPSRENVTKATLELLKNKAALDTADSHRGRRSTKSNHRRKARSPSTSSSSEYKSSSSSDEEEPRVRTKAVNLDKKIEDKLTDAFAKLTLSFERKFEALAMPPQPTYQPQIVPTFAATTHHFRSQRAPANPGGCFFCRGPHYMTNCTVLEHYAAVGCVIRCEGRIRLPDGTPLPIGPNGMKEAVDQAFGKPLEMPATESAKPSF